MIICFRSKDNKKEIEIEFICNNSGICVKKKEIDESCSNCPHCVVAMKMQDFMQILDGENLDYKNLKNTH